MSIDPVKLTQRADVIINAEDFDGAAVREERASDVLRYIIAALNTFLAKRPEGKSVHVTINMEADA